MSWHLAVGNKVKAVQLIRLLGLQFWDYAVFII